MITTLSKSKSVLDVDPDTNEHSNFSTLNVLDCRCGADLCRGKLERRDAKKEKETLAASLKRKLLEAATPDPVEPVVLKKRKTGRWSKGWSYVDPEMEALRLKEDAIETGKGVDDRALEKLKEVVVKQDGKKSAASTIGRGGRAAGLAAKAKIVERANSVRSVLSRRKGDPKATQDKKDRRKSLLGRATSMLRSDSAATLDTIEVALDPEEAPVETKRFSFEEESKPVDTTPSVEAKGKKIGASKSMRQSTLGFLPVKESKVDTSVSNPDLAEGEDVLEMILRRSSSARAST